MGAHDHRLAAGVLADPLGRRLVRDLAGGADHGPASRRKPCQLPGPWTSGRVICADGGRLRQVITFRLAEEASPAAEPLAVYASAARCFRTFATPNLHCA